jgi:signal transduction histidine kinase
VLLEGEMQFMRTVDGREIVLDSTTRPGSWGGWLPQFEITPVALGARITSDSRLLRMPIDSIRYALNNGFPLTHHVLAGFMSGVRMFASVAVQQEKLAALGRFSAGLAHELNNPASAARRATNDLREALRNRDQSGILLVDYIDVGHFRQMLRLVQEVGHREAVRLDPLERSDREEAMGAWLEQQGVDDGYQLGAALVDVGVTIADLDAIRTQLPAAAFPAVIHWLEAATTADGLARLIESSVGRISALVSAIKQYTFMDHDGQQEVDLHQGIDNTLLILHHELKNGVEVIRDYDPSLPKVMTYGSELNQVWTNLIDNAVQAMDKDGRLMIRTCRDGDRALVEIGDDGPGIPEEILPRIFEPFFTTKSVGVGTGLGLDIVRRIVWRHGGDIRVESVPGDTRFQVRLPFR